MADNSSELIEVDFKNAVVEVVTEKGIKIGENWYPKSHCNALVNYKKGQAVGIVALPQWIVEQKNLVESAQKHAGKKAEEIVKKVLTPKVQELQVTCPNCQHSIGLRFGVEK